MSCGACETQLQTTAGCCLCVIRRFVLHFGLRYIKGALRARQRHGLSCSHGRRHRTLPTQRRELAGTATAIATLDHNAISRSNSNNSKDVDSAIMVAGFPCFCILHGGYQTAAVYHNHCARILRLCASLLMKYHMHVAKRQMFFQG